MKACAFALALLATLVLTPRSAYAVDGTTLYQNCLAFDKPQPTELDQRGIQFCVGYLMGAYEFIDIDSHRVNRAGKDVDPYEICFPEHISTQEIILVYMNYMKANPTMLHQFAGLGVLNAFVGAYPCKK